MPNENSGAQNASPTNRDESPANTPSTDADASHDVVSPHADAAAERKGCAGQKARTEASNGDAENDIDGAFAAAGADRRPSSDDLRTDGGLLTGGDDDVHPTDLTQFQTDILAILAGGGTDAETQTGLEADYGLAIKRALEGYYGQEVYHGRLYPNLDDLFEKGLVERGSVDKRTNSYALTDAGRDLLRGRIEWLADQAGLDVMEVDHRLANTEPVTKEGDD